VLRELLQQQHPFPWATAQCLVQPFSPARIAARYEALYAALIR
jgi:hypothetical protein